MNGLVLEGVSKRYGAVAALEGVGLTVAPGSRTAVVGPSGSGKTTLLRLVAGFEAPDSGRITLDGALLADGSAAMPAHRRRVGIVAQDGALFPHLSIAENIGFGLRRGDAGRGGRIAALMEMVELDPSLLARRPDQLSGGQQQRVALARAMACQPRLLLLDEPFSALDTALRASTRRAVADVLGRAGITALLVTHDQAEAMSFADQVAVMRAGRLVQVGSPQALYAHPTDPATAEFLGDAIILPAVLAGGWADCALGRVEVAAADGRATIMVRPEQLVLTLPAVTGACLGEVVEVDFAGATCTYAVRLVKAPGKLLQIRQSSLDRFVLGTMVEIRMQGRAHCFTSPQHNPGGFAA